MGGVPNFTFSLALGGSEKGRTTAHGLINCYSSSSVYSHSLKKKYIDTIITGIKKKGNQS